MAKMSDAMLPQLFQLYPGFQEVRLINGRSAAIIKYADEQQAGIAMHALQGGLLPEAVWHGRGVCVL